MLPVALIEVIENLPDSTLPTHLRDRTESEMGTPNDKPEY